MLLEEPELSLHQEIVRVLPQMFARVQRKTGQQIFLSTHSPELLRDEGIGLDEALLIVPKTGGARITPAEFLPQVSELLAGGLTLADIVLPQTRPQQGEQLSLLLNV